MFVIDYKNKTVKEFKKEEFAYFLNSTILKDRYLIVDTKEKTENVLNYIINNNTTRSWICLKKKKLFMSLQKSRQ